jgi:hypothetical protein
LTLELTGIGAGASMKVRSWPIAPAGDPPGKLVFEDTIY